MPTELQRDDLHKRVATLSPEKRRLLELRLQKKNGALTDRQVIPRRQGSGPCPLSFAQQRLWLIHQLEPDIPMYNMPKLLRLAGNLNLNALKQALDQLVGRHEILRTTIDLVEGEPVQRVTESWAVALPIIDLSDRSEEEVQGVLLQEINRPFDLRNDLMIRATLFRLAGQDYLLLLVTHHIATDHWSTAILLHELATLYKAALNGQPSTLPELPIQYADFAVWQREWLQGETLEQLLAYWHKQLQGELPILNLPTDRPRPKLQSYQGARLPFVLSPLLSQALIELSRREQATTFMTLLAAFKILLYRYTGQEDILIGIPIAGRKWVEIEKLIGFFVNTLVLRTDLSGQPTFLELLRRVREVTLESYNYQDLPFEKLIETLAPERDLSRSPIFQVMFNFASTPGSGLDFPDLQVSRMEIDKGKAMFDLSLDINERAGVLSGSIEYNTDLFDLTTVERMIGHFKRLLEGIVANPELPIWQLPLLTEAERYQLLVAWNETAADYPRDRAIHQLFETQTQQSPNATALIFQGQALSYAELNARANQLAHLLISYGLNPETPVGIFLDRSPEMAVAMLGILKAGGAYVPLDPTYPHERLAFIMEDTHMPLILTQERLSKELPTYPGRVICLDSAWTVAAQQPKENPACPITGENLAYIIYTSGSTGKPKGTLITHRGLVNHSLAVAEHYGFQPNDRMLQFASISFDVAAEELFPTWSSGATVVFRSEEILTSWPEFHQFLEREAVTVLNLPAPYWHEWVSELVRVGGELPSSVRLVIVGSDKVLPEQWSNWQKLFGSRVRCFNAYGPTEATITATIYDPAAHQEKEIIHSVPIGRPIRNTQIYLLDAHLQPVPIGVPGELCIGGAGLARGYFNQPELTGEKFIPNPFKTNDELKMMNAESDKSISSLITHHSSFIYRTGDLARYLPDGNLEFLGRIDYQVKIRGFRIELGEIEATLSQHPAVRAAVVLAHENDAGDKHLVAYIVPQPAQTPTSVELRGFLLERIPGYMLPAAFMILANLPLMPNGKVDRRALPGYIQAAPEQAYTAPRDELERQLVRIWEEVLGVQPVGVRDSFFDLGGHSMLAVRLLSRIEQVTSRRLHLATLFQAPTIEQQARLFQERQDGVAAFLLPIQPHGSKLPFFCVPGGGDNAFIFTDLARHLGSDQPFYAFRFPHHSGDSELFSTAQVEAMAAQYIQAIKTLQPEGPYLLGGYCFGGKVAFEMAQQLHAQGQQVSLVAIFESYLPGASHLPGFTPRLRHHLSHFWQLPAREKAAYLLERSKKRLMKLSRTYFPNLGRSVHLALGETGYVPRPYSGRLTLFRAKERLPELYSDPYMGWGGFAAGGIEVYEIPGTHIDAYKEPNVRTWADQLRGCLDRAQQVIFSASLK